MQYSQIIASSILLTIGEVVVVSLVFQTIPDYWRKSQRLAIAWALIYLLVVNLWLVWLSSSGWFADPAHATTVQVVAAAGQLVFAVILVGLSFRTVQANAAMARETKRMAEVAVQQQRAAIKPVLVFRVWSTSDDERRPQIDAFRIEAINVGAGPALETFVRVNGPPKDRRHQDVTVYGLPCAAASSNSPTWPSQTSRPVFGL